MESPFIHADSRNSGIGCIGEAASSHAEPCRVMPSHALQGICMPQRASVEGCGLLRRDAQWLESIREGESWREIVQADEGVGNNFRKVRCEGS
jgi:hypothetical protein